MTTRKMTTAQRDAIYGFFKYNNPHRKRDGYYARSMGGAVSRMIENMRDAGLWFDCYVKGRPPILNDGPTVAGIDAWLDIEPDLTPELKAKALARRSEIATAAMQWEAMQADEREQNRAMLERRQAKSRALKVEKYRALIASHGFPNASDDEAILTFIERVCEIDVYS